MGCPAYFQRTFQRCFICIKFSAFFQRNFQHLFSETFTDIWRTFSALVWVEEMHLSGLLALLHLHKLPSVLSAELSASY